MESEGVSLPLIHEHLMMPCNDLIRRRGYCCGRLKDINDGYYCKSCDFFVHKKCGDSSEYIEHPSHLGHTLRLRRIEDRCYDLCGWLTNDLCYHCEICEFNVDLYCANYPPPDVIDISETHHHKLILLKKQTDFACDAKCGKTGYFLPYKCYECDLSFDVDCVWHPSEVKHLLEVNLLTEVNHFYHSLHSLKLLNGRSPDYSAGKCRLCGIKKVDELEGVPEEPEDIEPYVVIDANTIRHFSHEEHHLRLHDNGVPSEKNKWCSACTHPISLQSFYSCMDCDFILHQICAEFPRKKRHVLHNERLTLVTTEAGLFQCTGCHRHSNGFRYEEGYAKLDLQCSSISEPFFHPSHPYHPLFHHSPDEEAKSCNGCNKCTDRVLGCIEKYCAFAICFKCATLPLVVEHRVDDRPLSLCYGEEASGKYWCDICEKETNPKTWFYTCKDNQASLHTLCVLGDFSGLMPKRRISDDGKDLCLEAVLNNSVSRPDCLNCNLRCIFPIILHLYFNSSSIETYGYICALDCLEETMQRLRIHLEGLWRYSFLSDGWGSKIVS